MKEPWQCNFKKMLNTIKHCLMQYSAQNTITLTNVALSNETAGQYKHTG